MNVTQEIRDKGITLFREKKYDELIALGGEIGKANHNSDVLLRGLIEYSNYCSSNCLYCGIRRDNDGVLRYRLTDEDIFYAVKTGHERGLRTFVLQGGEDTAFTTDRICRIVETIKKMTNNDSAVTLSCGFRRRGDYKLLREAGADRYLMRFETSDPKLHKYLRDGMSLEKRLEALQEIKDVGFEAGSGFMIGLPEETDETRINNVLLCHELELDMCGIGPFIPHDDTPLKGSPQEPIETSVALTALLRIHLPEAHIPATTAAGSLDPQGREMMIEAGANVLMPNLTPVSVKKDYLLYPGKICLDEDGLQCVGCLDMRVRTKGRKLSFAKGSALRVQRAEQEIKS